MSSNKEKNREIINITLDETKSAVKKTTDEAIKEIPRIQKPLMNIKKKTIQATKRYCRQFSRISKRDYPFSPILMDSVVKTSRTHIGLTGPLRNRATENYARAVSNITDNTYCVN